MGNSRKPVRRGRGKAASTPVRHGEDEADVTAKVDGGERKEEMDGVVQADGTTKVDGGARAEQPDGVVQADGTTKVDGGARAEQAGDATKAEGGAPAERADGRATADEGAGAEAGARAEKPEGAGPEASLEVRVDYRPSASFSHVEVSLRYEDPEHALDDSWTTTFDAAGTRVWKIALLDPSRRAFRWRVCGFTGAGEVVTGAWCVGREPVVVVDAAVLARLGQGL